MHGSFIRLATLFSFVLCMATVASAQAQLVTIEDKGAYFSVAVDLSDPATTRQEAGQALGRAIKTALPDIESLMDSFLAGLCPNNEVYLLFLSRTASIWPQVPEPLQRELDGMASTLCSTTENILGDGKISRDELRMLNLSAEVMRTSQCSAVGVLPAASQSGKCTVARNLEWDNGDSYQASRLQAVTVYDLPGAQNFTLIGYLGTINCLTGFNSNGVFAAILDSGTDREPYTAADKRAYSFDLRAVLENSAVTTADMVTMQLQSHAGEYTYGHLIFLADASTVKVLEDDVLPDGVHVRDVNSAPLYYDWTVPHTVGAVNCNMLPASTDNAGDPWDVRRWESQQRLLRENGSKHSWTDLQTLAGYGPGLGSAGYLYIKNPKSGVDTQQIVLFEPETKRLDIAFHPKGRALNDDEVPVFTTINPDVTGVPVGPKALVPAFFLVLLAAGWGMYSTSRE